MTMCTVPNACLVLYREIKNHVVGLGEISIQMRDRKARAITSNEQGEVIREEGGFRQ